MYDIRNLNIWKEEKTADREQFLSDPIEILSLSTRSFNSLKRAGVVTIGEVIRLIEAEEGGLRKIRNLGAGSEREILENVDRYRTEEGIRPEDQEMTGGRRKVIKPSGNMLDTSIDTYRLSEPAREDLHRCGVRRVRDLYRRNLKKDPGWYAVRELFEELSLKL